MKNFRKWLSKISNFIFFLIIIEGITYASVSAGVIEIEGYNKAIDALGITILIVGLSIVMAIEKLKGYEDVG